MLIGKLPWYGARLFLYKGSSLCINLIFHIWYDYSILFFNFSELCIHYSWLFLLCQRYHTGVFSGWLIEAAFAKDTCGAWNNWSLPFYGRTILRKLIGAIILLILKAFIRSAHLTFSCSVYMCVSQSRCFSELARYFAFCFLMTSTESWLRRLS